MSRYFMNHEEQECFNEGRRDQREHSRNYERDRYSDCPCDEAYFAGMREERLAQERRAEERAQEEAEMMHQQELAYQHEQEERQAEEEQAQLAQEKTT